jgi:hypothetical protein
MGNFNTIVNGLATSPKVYEISKAMLATNAGGETNIIELIQDIKITESLYNSGLTVAIYCLDSTGLIDLLKIAGNEKIELVIERRDITDKTRKKFELEVYLAEIKDYSTPRPSSKAYTLYCVSEHVYLNAVKVLTRSFNNTPSNLIKSIVSKELNSEIDIRNPSTSPIKGIFPRLRPLSAIAWLLRNSFENATPNFFYETAKSGLIFDSYKKILDKDVYDTYDNHPNFKYTSKDEIEDLFDEERKKIRKVNSNLNLSKLKASEKGAFGSTLHTIDVYNKTTETKLYNYKNEQKLNDHPPVTDKMKYNNAKITDYKLGKNYFISYNSGSFEGQNNYHAPTDQSILRSEAHHHNLDTIIQDLVLPGDFDIESGDIIDLDILRNADVTDEKKEAEDFKDNILSGKHLITGIIHHFSNEGYFMKVKVKKDSFLKELEGIKQS